MRSDKSRARAENRTRTLLVGAALLVAGGAVAGFGWTTPTLVLAGKAVLVLAGLGLIFHGIARLVVGFRGKPVDLLFVLAVVWLIGICVAAVLAPLLPLGEHNDVAKTLVEPTNMAPSLLTDHPLGTNNQGLDLLSRSLHGARTSLAISLLAVTIGTVVGGAIGVMAGYFRKGVDSVVGIFTNALLAVPPLILLITLSTFLDPSLRNMALALSLLTIPSMVRLARANTIAFAQREFVMAARLMGATRFRVMTRELVPNVLLPVCSMAVVMISALIVAEASLSFLGLGIQQPDPTWGNMIAEGEGGAMEDYPHIVLVPGAFLFLTVFSFNLLGEKAQKRWDTRSAKL
ncbi:MULTISPECIES: ABC transporter permease [unclassified Nocardioides]|uniref:ABC transporter permease n=1 Tax=unclassified Nocardioides TaxID=2615069 RepID=UPI0006FA95A2|nr:MULTISPECIES: ABC transporter permease [unclassified Nocardioides]KQY51006.1 ABC transporter permease [Nocardioides sp. Root140]KRF15203.1 ABC transporter permease [Nocardioides sp. Soil796]